MNICIVEKSKNELKLMKPFWILLNSIRFNKSIYFKKDYEELKFEKRMEIIYEKAQKGKIKFNMLLDNNNGKYIGYSLSSIENNLGEIESIYIDVKYRRIGLGGKIMRDALNWFEVNSITDIQMNVVYANVEALLFYERYGFYIGNYILKRKSYLNHKS
ncbi:GNAT family N-acetyltransferase [Clostridium algoriphilum]|uniref:GNAT family N-acetyltransferase n=1 Tax=Clostridium algoriphilum TaxID=198347 RepID=UPI001CF3B471|nr:GNAT family N-acetyltransferase [Clostridium algoriphilum]MCB2294251.1 GNAT family N-acetyltransferase [Clostridium algoriphilum]